MDATGTYTRKYVVCVLILLLQALCTLGSDTDGNNTTECTVSSDCSEGRFCEVFTFGRNVTLCLPHQKENDLCDPNTDCNCAAGLSCQLFLRHGPKRNKPAFPVYRCQSTTEPTPSQCKHNTTDSGAVTAKAGNGTTNLRDILTGSDLDMEMSGSGSYEMTRDEFLEQLKKLLLSRSHKEKKTEKKQHWPNKGKKFSANHHWNL